LAAFPFSAFRRNQLVFELRYAPAYAFWDRAGLLSTEIGQLFKTFQNTSAQPGQVTFTADDRYALAASLDRASITDHQPQTNLESTFEIFAAFSDIVATRLSIQIFTRIGARYFYTIECKSLKEARDKAKLAVITTMPSRLFGIDLISAAPMFRLEADDGELAFNAQIYARENRVDFIPPPDASALGIEKVEKLTFQLVLDVDFFTKKPVARESFEAKSWLMGWSKSITRGADEFLNLAGSE
jgi:hypothetical protein